MFASQSLVEHVARGLLGLGALMASALLAPTSPWAALALLPVALVALRGCPMCWTLGLIQMVMARARGERPGGRVGRVTRIAARRPPPRGERQAARGAEAETEAEKDGRLEAWESVDRGPGAEQRRAWAARSR
ncbi:hypothetical protein WME89_32010 [Sorangium sp. So ce321]|uniref:hypothetical protein n=1 Tax=Sorangium sp. So ce321 TaxID=3133300 RepID=UPI003F5F348F